MAEKNKNESKLKINMKLSSTNHIKILISKATNTIGGIVLCRKIKF